MSINNHESDFKFLAWEMYSIQELGMWIHLLCKRAEHRNNAEKCAKDIYDAENYLSMMQLKIEFLKRSLLNAND